MLKELIGRKVVVWSLAAQGEHRDEGMLENYDEQYLVLNTGKERLYFVLMNVRLVKAVD